jgi:hypothetical protein
MSHRKMITLNRLTLADHDAHHEVKCGLRLPGVPERTIRRRGRRTDKTFSCSKSLCTYLY